MLVPVCSPASCPVLSYPTPPSTPPSHTHKLMLAWYMGQGEETKDTAEREGGERRKRSREEKEGQKLEANLCTKEGHCWWELYNSMQWL